MLERLFPQQADDKLFVEDVFSTYLYTGNGATQTITNGIDLAGKGGLIWSKGRSGASGAQRHNLFDTARGKGSFLSSNSTNEQFTFTSDTQDLTSFNSNGFSVGIPYNANVNQSSTDYATWTFREAPNFFDVVTYTGTGANRTIAHNLGVAPGMILVKRTDTTGDWQVYHRSNANTQYMVLNDTAAVATGATRWNSTTPTATEFSVGTDATVNASGGTYVAYLFAHVPGSDGLIQCGSFTANGGNAVAVNLGWEPQWFLAKASNAAGSWFITDNMRGFVTGSSASASDDAALLPASSSAEITTGIGSLTATGVETGFTGTDTYIYVAIRRGPMRTPTLGTSVFSPVYATSAASPYTVTTNFPVDLVISAGVSGYSKNTIDRLRGGTTTRHAVLITDSTAAESTGSSSGIGFQNNTAVVDNSFWSGYGLNIIYWNFRRAPGFFDVVCYTGTGVASTNTINHNLGVAPELIIIKSRNNALQWGVMHTFAPTTLSINTLNTNAAAFSSDYATILWATGQPTATQFALYGASTSVNTSGATYVSYLFASCPGVSKVGSYTGNGSSQTINCAFTTGARFVMIKRTNAAGDWYVWDSARGIVAGNDPYLALNSTAAEVTTNDSVDPNSTGFIVNQDATTNINVNGGTYIFLAIA